MKKFVAILWMFALAASTTILVSCSEDEDNIISTNGESSGEGDFIEITLDGKTYRHNVNKSVYQSTPIIDDGMKMTAYLSFDNFRDYGFTFSYGLSHYADQSRLLGCSVGNYPVTSYGPSDEDEPLMRNLEFDANLSSNVMGRNWVPTGEGTHTVTSIKAAKDDVVIEGTFNITMCGGWDESLEERRVSGKYRMTVDCYKTSI